MRSVLSEEEIRAERIRGLRRDVPAGERGGATLLAVPGGSSAFARITCVLSVVWGVRNSSPLL